MAKKKPIKVRRKGRLSDKKQWVGTVKTCISPECGCEFEVLDETGVVIEDASVRGPSHDSWQIVKKPFAKCPECGILVPLWDEDSGC